MKKIILFVLPLAVALGSGCKKTPTACISADKSEALTDESITFTSCSENSEKISWDFGDGKMEEGNSVAHAYSKAGTYLIKMSAFSKKDKKWDKTSTLVTITVPPVPPPPPPPAKRFLTNIVLKSFAAKNPSNEDWDSGAELISGTGPEPDIFVKFGLSTGEWAVTTSIISDAKISNVPKTWIYTPQNIYLASNDWEVTISESDVFGSEEMQKWTINPSTEAASNGVISLTAPSYSLDIYFEER